MLKTKVAELEATEGRHQRHLRRRATATSRRSTTACWSPSAAAPTASTSAPRSAGVAVNERGFIPVDKQMRTNVPHIFAIGDIVGQPMLAHKAVHEGKVAAEVDRRPQGGVRRPRDPVGGLHRSRSGLGRGDRDRSQGQGHRDRERRFPWAASGRALSIGRTKA